MSYKLQNYLYYNYDDFGNPYRQTDPLGKTTKEINPYDTATFPTKKYTYDFDGLFRVKEEQNPFFDSFSTKLTNITNQPNKTKYSYDALSRIISVINPDGTTKYFSYGNHELHVRW